MDLPASTLMPSGSRPGTAWRGSGRWASQSAKEMGAERINAMSRHKSRQELARGFGATDIVAERGGPGIQRVKEQLNTAKQEERSLELELEKTRIMAPFGGVVARRYTREGQSVAKGDRLFWVTAEGPLRIRFTLPEKYIGHLKRGQELPLFSPDLPAEKHMAKIIAISPVVDPSSATIEALAELVGGRGELRPGMSVAVRVANLP